MKFLLKSIQGLTQAVKRFPLAVIALISETVLLWYLIAIDKEPTQILLKWVFILMISIVVGISVQFFIERFNRDNKFKAMTYYRSLVLIAGYAFIIWPSPEIDYLVGTRTAVAIVALISAALYIPAYKKGFEFNLVALTGFKAMFTSVLYAFVLFLGLMATLASIDLLLFNIDTKLYGYTAVLVWLLFMVLYFLSLLPNFNSEDEIAIAHRNEQTSYPKILLILISYIAIPLVAIYSSVLFAYIAKIIITFEWPIGQLGPMVLAYSIAGLVVYILASNLNNAFAKAYQRFFPIAWLPIVVVQLISIYIRLAAYGITESRYYLALFGLYSLGMGIYLFLNPVVKNKNIALVAMIIALMSIVPPMDAFSVSRWSQRSRIETILEEASILVDGVIYPNANVDLDTRKETTSILAYMNQRNYLADLEWLDEAFSFDTDFKEVFGFEKSYMYDSITDIFNAYLDYDVILPIENYSVMTRMSIYPDRPQDDPKFAFTLNSINYHLNVEYIDGLNVKVEILDEANQIILECPTLYDFVNQLRKVNAQPMKALNVEDMMFDLENETLSMRIIFQNINIYNDQANYEVYVLVGAK